MSQSIRETVTVTVIGSPFLRMRNCFPERRLPSTLLRSGRFPHCPARGSSPASSMT
jgi:hypothetical protein